MQRSTAIAGSAIFLILVPGTVAFVVPWIFSGWQLGAPLLGFFGFRLLGALSFLAGLPVLLDACTEFALRGLGTPAPLAPPQRLVVTGFYRYMRNPMYTAVVALILGQGLFFGSIAVLEYAFFLWIGFCFFVLLYEEPTLHRKFGAEYEEYCAHVPRWIPRVHPYRSEVIG